LSTQSAHTKEANDKNKAWSRFRSNPLAMSGLAFICLVALVALLGPIIRPDKTVNANDQSMLLSSKKPGFIISVIRIKTEQPPTGFFDAWLAGGRPKSFQEIPIAEIDLHNDSVVVREYSAAGVGEKKYFHKEVLEKRIVKLSAENEKEAYVFDKKFVLGTDKYGRDLLSRLMAGASISLAVGTIAVIISLLVGLTLGLIAGYYRGWVDNVIMWFTNVVWAIPTLILVMAITFAFGTGFWKVFLAVGLTMWVEVARIARGQVLSVREKEYVEAARALGFSEMRIIFKHILPNILSPIIVISAANFASAILIEAGLSFLGLGAQIPTPSWGNMIREHYAFITTDLAYLAILPGVCIMLLVLSFMMVGNGLRDALDVRG
jgi:peptide/nickel transport system permease protein